MDSREEIKKKLTDFFEQEVPASNLVKNISKLISESIDLDEEQFRTIVMVIDSQTGRPMLDVSNMQFPFVLNAIMLWLDCLENDPDGSMKHIDLDPQLH